MTTRVLRGLAVTALVVSAVTAVGTASTARAAALGWTVVAAESPPGENATLFSVATITTGDVWAVGDHWADGGNGFPRLRTLAERFDGTGFVRTPTPDVAGAKLDWLAALAGSSGSDVWAVGGLRTTDAAPIEGLIEHWDGTAWTLVPDPLPKPDRFSVGASLTGVAALAPDDVWAVGGRADGSARPAAIHWDGVAWAAVTVPQPSPCNRDATLSGIAAISAHNVWASGRCDSTESGEQQAYVVHWNGRRWAVSDGSVTSSAGLNAISAASKNSVWTVGHLGATGRLVMRWDGHHWTTVTAGADDAGTLGVLARRGDLAWTVGGPGGTGGTGGTGGRGPATQRLTATRDQRLNVPSATGTLRAISSGPTGHLWVAGMQLSPDRQHVAPLVAMRPSG